MKFNQIHQENNAAAQLVYQSYSATFPPDERRNFQQFQNLFRTPEAKVFSTEIAGCTTGYVIVWELSGFCFLEHFEIFEKYRGKKIGSMVLEALLAQYPTILLETEPADLGETANRRVRFYLENGFSILDKNYMQPPYDEGKNTLNLWLMSNNTLADSAFCTQEIHRKVYGFGF